MPKLIFHPDVYHELKNSYEWYENQANGLGDNFLSELEEAYQVIVELPGTWPKFKKGFRRFILTKFPFSVIYKETPQSIFIVAIMHNSRKPGYWLKRM